MKKRIVIFAAASTILGQSLGIVFVHAGHIDRGGPSNSGPRPEMYDVKALSDYNSKAAAALRNHIELDQRATEEAAQAQAKSILTNERSKLIENLSNQEKSLVNQILEKICREIESEHGGTAKIYLAANFLNALVNLHEKIPLGHPNRIREFTDLSERLDAPFSIVRKSKRFEVTQEQIKNTLEDLRTEGIDPRVISTLDSYFVKNTEYIKSGLLKVGVGVVFGGTIGIGCGTSKNALGGRSFIWNFEGSGYGPCLGPIISFGYLRGDVAPEEKIKFNPPSGRGEVYGIAVIVGGSEVADETGGITLTETSIVGGCSAPGTISGRVTRHKVCTIQRDYNQLREKLGLTYTVDTPVELPIVESNLNESISNYAEEFHDQEIIQRQMAEVKMSSASSGEPSNLEEVICLPLPPAYSEANSEVVPAVRSNEEAEQITLICTTLEQLPVVNTNLPAYEENRRAARSCILESLMEAE